MGYPEPLLATVNAVPFLLKSVRSLPLPEYSGEARAFREEGWEGSMVDDDDDDDDNDDDADDKGC
eukprot:182147-Rhodomonas_salina.2